VGGSTSIKGGCTTIRQWVSVGNNTGRVTPLPTVWI